VQRL
jgi:acetyl-CoA acyltransferase 1